MPTVLRINYKGQGLKQGDVIGDHCSNPGKRMVVWTGEVVGRGGTKW